MSLEKAENHAKKKLPSFTAGELFIYKYIKKSPFKLLKSHTMSLQLKSTIVNSKTENFFTQTENFVFILSVNDQQTPPVCAQ